MSNKADSSIPPNSFCTIEQTIKEANLKFQAEFLPAGSSFSQAQDTPTNI